MGYTPLDKEHAIESGHAIAKWLSANRVVLNYHYLVNEFTYADATDSIVVRAGENVIIFPRENFGVADWDDLQESESHDTSFYMILDADDIVHIFHFYTPNSQEIMRQLKELL